MEKNTKLLLVAALTAGALCSAVAQEKSAYVRDTSEKLVRSGFDSCVRSGTWTQDKALASCEATMASVGAKSVTPATPTAAPVAARPSATAAEMPAKKEKKSEKKMKKGNNGYTRNTMGN